MSHVTSLTAHDGGANDNRDRKEPISSEDDDKRLLRKIDLYRIVDKATLNSSSILGLNRSLKLSAEEYNWLGTIFFVAFLIFQFPQNLALKRFPTGIWIGLNCLIWSISIGAQAACKNFTQILICRFILGACEGCVTPGFMRITGSFYTHREQSTRTAYWFFMSGVSQILSGVMSYAVLHIKSQLSLWKLYFIITSSLTFAISILIIIFFPTSPNTSWFLTQSERERAIDRIRSNQTGIEEKSFDFNQAKEAFQDIKTWIWFLFCISVSIPNSLGNQVAIIVVSFGYTIEQTTLLSCCFGLVTIVSMLSAVKLIDKTQGSRGFIGAFWYLPSILGAILVITLPWNDRIGLLVAIFLASLSSTPFVISLGWINSTTAGHTKRAVVQAIVLIGYSIGNILGPQMWKESYKPKNRIPWIIIIICFGVCFTILIGMSEYLKYQNLMKLSKSKMNLNQKETNDEVLKDLTDLQNPSKLVLLTWV
ncbi:major facilitator superfamily domain-containing protein [Melampsora americana]|nr:major facilitator superfamily domain-containing protein [Melampsora americana]